MKSPSASKAPAQSRRFKILSKHIGCILARRMRGASADEEAGRACQASGGAR